MSFICHDFKTPRNDSSRRLPGTMRIVPVIFYIVTLGSIYSVFRDMRLMKEYDERKAIAGSQRDEQVAAKESLASELVKLTTERAVAEQVAKWVEGTRSLQPVSVAVAEAVGFETFISDLTVERSPDVPSQLNLVARMSNAGQPEIQKIDEGLRKLSYRAHSPNVDRNGDNLEYRTMLIRQEP
jgi:hypothetical protein